MVPRKAVWTPAVALVLLVAAGCGTPDATPKPVTIPTITTSPQVSTTVPENNTISVQPRLTIEPTADATTESSPAEIASPPVLAPAPPEVTRQPRQEPVPRPFVMRGDPCEPKGALALNMQGRPMICASNGHGKLRWQPV